MEQIRHLQLALLFSASGVALCLYSLVQLIQSVPKVSPGTWAAIAVVAIFDYMAWRHLTRVE